MVAWHVACDSVAGAFQWWPAAESVAMPVHGLAAIVTRTVNVTDPPDFDALTSFAVGCGLNAAIASAAANAAPMAGDRTYPGGGGGGVFSTTSGGSA